MKRSCQKQLLNSVHSISNKKNHLPTKKDSRDLDLTTLDSEPTRTVVLL